MLTDDDIIKLAAEHDVAKAMKPIGLDTGDVLHTEAGYRTAEVLDFARAIESEVRAGVAVPPDLHQQIVNLHFRRPAGLSTDPDNFRWMELGFKQARAQIAELVSAALSTQTQEPSND